MNSKIIDILKEALLPKNQECDGPHCQGCWKDKVNEAIKLLQPEKDITEKQSEIVHYEARLSRNVTRTHYAKTVYSKGVLIERFTEKEFNRLNKKNISTHFHPQITLGHGASEYFDIKKDIEFVKVTTSKTIKEQAVKLK
jgi:hypothetical protein